MSDWKCNDTSPIYHAHDAEATCSPTIFFLPRLSSFAKIKLKKQSLLLQN